MSVNTDDREFIVQTDDDHTGPEPWQLDRTCPETGSYEARSKIPRSDSHRSGELNKERGQRTHGYTRQDDPGYSPAPNRRITEYDELSAPPNENLDRARWGSRRDLYQTTAPGYYNLPTVHSHPGAPHLYTANNCPQSNNIVVVQTGNSINPISTATHVTHNTALSVFVSVLCCLPLGLCAFIYSIDSQTMWMLGYTDEAHKRSRTSKNLNIAGIVIGLTLITLILVFIFVII